MNEWPISFLLRLPSSSGTHCKLQAARTNQQARKQASGNIYWMAGSLPPSDARIWGKSTWELDSLPHTFHKYDMILWLKEFLLFLLLLLWFVCDRYTISLQCCSLPVSKFMQFQDWLSQKNWSYLNIWFWGIFTKNLESLIKLDFISIHYTHNYLNNFFFNNISLFN